MSGGLSQFPARDTALQDSSGVINQVWYRFLFGQWKKTGAGTSTTTIPDLSAALVGKVNRSGDAMTGPLSLSGNPTIPLQAATKGYVDAQAAGSGPPPSPTVPKPVGTAATGAEAAYSRGDHIHGTVGQKGYIARLWEAGATVGSATYSGGPAALVPFRIDGIDAVSLTGSFTVAVLINGVSVGGLGAIGVTGAPSHVVASGGNTVAVGGLVTFLVTLAAGGPTNVNLTLNTTRI